MKLSVKNGLLLGLLFGGVAAILYAPKAGKELRSELKEKIDLVPEHFSNLVESIVDLVVSVIDFGVDACEEQGERISNAVSSGLCAAKNKAAELKNMATK